MKDRHFVECPMCGYFLGQLDFCDRIHADGGQAARSHRVYLDTQGFGQSPQPHFHLTCGRCGYEWVEAV